MVQRMKDAKSGEEVPLVGVKTTALEPLAEIVRRLKEGELTATPEEVEQIRNRLLEIRGELLDAEIRRLEAEIRQLEMEELEDEIAELEREIKEDEERERKLKEQTASAPPSVPQLADIVATPPPKSTLKVNAAPFQPSWLKPKAPVPSPVTTSATLPKISVTEFESAHKAGTLTMRAVKWWSSKNFPHHNIEIALSIGGRPWAIAHVKWNDRNGPDYTNVSMATFKAADGNSIPDGNIWGGTVRDLLVAESIKHKAKAPPLGAPHADVRI
jgi:hypothetical protein